jgi:hypothetical protein
MSDEILREGEYETVALATVQLRRGETPATETTAALLAIIDRISTHNPAIAARADERERVRSLGENPVAGRCAYEAFATATREELDLPPWDAIPADARAHWQMTADGLLMFASMGEEP